MFPYWGEFFQKEEVEEDGKKESFYQKSHFIKSHILNVHGFMLP